MSHRLRRDAYLSPLNVCKGLGVFPMSPRLSRDAYLSPLNVCKGLGGVLCVPQTDGCISGCMLCIQPIECVQRPGDVLYVPARWTHATINLDECVGLALELDTGDC